MTAEGSQECFSAMSTKLGSVLSSEPAEPSLLVAAQQSYISELCASCVLGSPEGGASGHTYGE